MVGAQRVDGDEQDVGRSLRGFGQEGVGVERAGGRGVTRSAFAGGRGAVAAEPAESQDRDSRQNEEVGPLQCAFSRRPCRNVIQRILKSSPSDQFSM